MGRNIAFLVLVCGALFAPGCAPQHSAEPRGPILAPNPVVQPIPVAAPWYPAIQLPSVGHSVPIPNDAYPIFIDDTRAYVGLPAVATAELPARPARGEAGFGHEKKPSPGDGFVIPLAQAVERRPCGPDGRVPDAAVVYSSPTMEYRVVLDALYTLSRIGYSRLFLATRSTTPELSRVGIRAPGGSNWALAVFVGDDGFSLSRTTKREPPLTCPGSTPPESGPAIPISSNGLDFAALGTCVAALTPAGSHIYLSPDGQLPLQTAISVAEAMWSERLVVFAFPTPKSKPETPRALSGTISNASLVVAAMRAPFRECYNRELGRVSSAEGNIRLSIRVGADGSVVTVTATPTGNLGGTVECVRAVAMSAKFDPPAGGSAVVVVPVTFVKTSHGSEEPRCGQR